MARLKILHRRCEGKIYHYIFSFTEVPSRICYILFVQSGGNDRKRLFAN